MIRSMLFLTLLFANALSAFERSPVTTYVDEPIIGWHWYNETVPEDEPEDEHIPLSALPPNLHMSILQALVKEKLNKAILNPTAENAGDYLRLQQQVTRQAGLFTKAAQKALLLFPELDYNLEYSHYNGTATTQLTAARQRQHDAVQALGEKYGLFLFYRGEEPIDNQMATVVSQFAQTHSLALIPVSVDGKRSEDLPQTRPDTGQVARMGISHFPALYLVSPDTEAFQPLAFGFMAQDDLARRFLDVATDFKPQF